MKAEEKRIILVTGVTGWKGSSVARALLKQQDFRVRILTPRPPATRSLVYQRAGADMIIGEQNDPAILAEAMRGVYGVYAGEKPGKAFIDIATRAGVQHLVMETNPLEEYAKHAGIATTSLHAPFLFENFLDEFAPQKDGKGGYYLDFPYGNDELPMASAEDLGKIVAALFSYPAAYAGKTIEVTGARHSPAEYAAIMSAVMKKRIYFNPVPANLYGAYDLPGAATLSGKLQAQAIQVASGSTKFEDCFGLNSSMQSFESWMVKHRDKFLLYFNSLFEAIVI